MQAISVIAKVSISIDLRNELRGDFFQCLQHDLQNATSKRYIKTLTQNASSNGGDASRVGQRKERHTNSAK